MSKVIVAICAYNVEETLEKTIASMPRDVADEIIVVDDGSSDRTVALARKLEETLDLSVIVHPENRGYGAVQKTAYSAAVARGGDAIALLHGDFQYDPASLPLLVAPLLVEAADMTFGSRFASDGDPLAGGMPLYRFVGNRMTTVLENTLLGTRFTDMHSGMRAFNRKCLLSLPFLSYRNDFAFDKQTTVDAVMTGLRVTEIPIPTRYDHESSSIPTIGSFRYVWHSLAYTSRAALERGRRGRRWEVRGHRIRYLVEEAPPAADVWNIVTSYIVPTRTFAAVGEVPSEIAAHAEAQGFTTATSDVGAAIVDRGSEADLRIAAESLHDEGLLIVLARDHRLRERLIAAGFGVIGWDRLGVAVARRRND
ncbi:MAG: glycosyltransferase family 2 protein [Actinobacteria bacterium]|nr:glycosyltransferase family 2 protein [Actinomycetota bacterium]